jgi:hypothetical protein
VALITRHVRERHRVAFINSNPLQIPRIEQRGRIFEPYAIFWGEHRILAPHTGATIARTDRGASALYFLNAAGYVAELIANDRLDNVSDARSVPNHSSRSQRSGSRLQTPRRLVMRFRRRFRRKSFGVAARGGC